MFVQKATAPTYRHLRPLKAQQTPTFPVYPDLAARLLDAKEHPDDTVAHTLAVCAGYAYSTADTVSMIMARLGLDDNQCLQVGQYVDAMFISSTAFVVQSRDGRVVVVAYRGTEPGNVLTWLTDIDVYPDTVQLDLPGSADGFEVHGGFYRNVRATRHEVVGALERAMDGRSVLADGRPGPGDGADMPDGGRMRHPMEALYITGHSQGGAMAALLAAMLVTEPAYTSIAERLRAVYTVGQPMVGNEALGRAADAHDFLGENLIRYVYRRDVVPRLPPTDSGDFRHFGREYRYDEGWPWTYAPRHTGQMVNLLGILEAPLALLARQLRWFRNVPFQHSLNDHLPHHYISALTPPGVGNEFGDRL